MALADVIAAFDDAAADRPLSLSMRRGDDAVLHRTAGTRTDGRPFTVDTPVPLYCADKAAIALTTVLLAVRGDSISTPPLASRWPASTSTATARARSTRPHIAGVDHAMGGHIEWAFGAQVEVRRAFALPRRWLSR